jgi:hypothetical protein
MGPSVLLFSLTWRTAETHFSLPAEIGIQVPRQLYERAAYFSAIYSAKGVEI